MGCDKVWVICVVVRVAPKEYKNYYVGVKGKYERAVDYKHVIARRGFSADGVRYFRDQIESIFIKDELLDQQGEK